MKHPKKLLALTLAFVLALGLGAPAMALEEEDTFRVITEDWQEITLPYGSDVVLSAEVYLPEGWTVEYEWIDSGYGGSTIIGEEATVRLSPGDPGYPRIHYTTARPYYYPHSAKYRCKMTVWDENETIVPGPHGSFLLHIEVTIEPEREEPIWEKIFDVLSGLFAGPMFVATLIFGYGFGPIFSFLVSLFTGALFQR